MILAQKDAFWWKGTGGNGNQLAAHLFCVLAVKVASASEYLVVPVCSLTNSSDRTCIINGATDHDDLTHISFIAYHLMRIARQNVLDVADLGDRIKPTKPFSSQVFGRICAGVSLSPDSIPSHQAFFLKHST